MKIKATLLTKSLWVYHTPMSSCNNCDIEVLDAFTPRFDIERLGIKLVNSPKHADILLVTGVVNKKTMDRALMVYFQTPRPCAVVAIGGCTVSGGIFRTSYSFTQPLDKHIPVDVYVQGCPPKPEAIIRGIMKAAKKLGV